MSFDDLDAAIDHAIVEALLAYFRPGQAADAHHLPETQFPITPRLLALHWAFSPIVGVVLARLLNRQGEIESASIFERAENAGRINGSVVWDRTVIRQARTSNPALTVYRDVRRTLDTGPNRILRYVVNTAIRTLQPYHSDSAVGESPYGQAIHENYRLALRAGRLLGLRQVGQDESHGEPSPRDLLQARRSRKAVYRYAANAAATLGRIKQGAVGDRQKVLEQTLVAPLQRWLRFEMFTAISVTHLLARRIGQNPQVHNLSLGMRGPAFSAGPYLVYWRGRPNALYTGRELTENELVTKAILERFNLPSGGESADVLIVDSIAQTVVALVECKYSESNVGGARESQFRDAVGQLVEYCQDFGAADWEKRLVRSAVVMSQLPQAVMATRSQQGDEGPVPMCGSDLLTHAEIVDQWVERIIGYQH